MKLAVKIAGTLVLVVAIALGLASYLIGRTADQTYRSYLSDAQRVQLEWLAGQIATLRASGEDWTAIQAWVNGTGSPAGNMMPMPFMHMPNSAMPGMHGSPRRQRNGEGAPAPTADASLLIVDLNGNPLGATAGQVTPERLNLGVPIEQAGEPVALLVPAQVGPRIGQAEQAVFAGIQRAILLSAVAAAVMALLLGGLLVWTILRPLRQMHVAVAAITHGDLGARVAKTGGDELGELGAAFNGMAARLESQEQLRRRLMADVAHELRTPLSVIQGNLQAILDGVFPLTHDEVEKVYLESNLLSRLIDDLHELAQAEAGALSLELQPIDVEAALRQMQHILEPVASAREITLRVDMPPSATILVADPDRLHQVLYNLIGNALRHTPPGGTVTVSARPLDDQFLRFTVQDTGPGIQSEHLPHIFDRFYRADRSRRRDGDPTAGAGLGLAIVRALVEAHGGRAGASSNPGQGATFWVDLPVTSAEIVQPSPAP